MVTQQTLKNIRNNLSSSFSTFNSSSKIASFVQSEMKKQFLLTNFYTDEKCSVVYKKAIEYLEEEINKSYNNIAKQINEYIDDLNKSFETSSVYQPSDADTLKHIAVGAGAGLGAALILGGPVGWLAAIGFAAGAVFNSEKKKNELINRIKNAADKLNGEAIKKLRDVLDLFIVEDVLLLPPSKEIFSPSNIVDNNGLTKEQIEIKEFLEEREIKYLVHFTDESKVNSIRKNGICSPKEGEKRGIKIDVNNDDTKSAHKAEKYMKSTPDDYISLTITMMNEKVLSRFKHDHKIKRPVRILIDANVLWKEIDKDRIYCNMNASAGSLSCGNSIDDFRAMFAPQVKQINYHLERSINDREKDKRPKNVATHIQAEILFQSNVDPKYLFFDNSEHVSGNTHKMDFYSSDVLDCDDLPF